MGGRKNRENVAGEPKKEKEASQNPQSRLDRGKVQLGNLSYNGKGLRGGKKGKDIGTYASGTFLRWIRRECSTEKLNSARQSRKT